MQLQEILDKFGDDLVNDTRASLEEKQKQKAAKYGSRYNQNSRLSASIKYFVTVQGDTIVMEFIMDESYYWVDKGRNPGNVSREGSASIERWIRRKGLTPKLSKRTSKGLRRITDKTARSTRRTQSIDKKVKSLAYVIKRKIQKDGYEANHFYSEVINDGRVEALKETVFKEFGKQIDILFEL